MLAGLVSHPWAYPALEAVHIVGIALLLRVVWAALVPVVPQSDGMASDTCARNLVNHGVFGWNPAEPFAYWPPGTSMF